MCIYTILITVYSSIHRFLATGESFISLAYQYRLGHSTVSESVHMTCRAIERQMMAAQFPKPTEQMWRNIATNFWEKWDFPNCIGAIDGKHINIRAPHKSGSLYFNYKKNFSIVLLALVDADCWFVNVQVGDYGRSSDGGTYSSSDLGRGMAAGALQVPADCPLPGSGKHGNMPFTMVGDAAFPSKPYLMKPFAGQRIPKKWGIYNYRLSRARMVAECAFGILAARWRVLYTRMQMKPENIDSLIMTVCILHNFLHNPSDNQAWLNEAEGEVEELRDVRNMGGNRGSRQAFAFREKLCDFFNSPEGSVPWQDRML